jgi:hypothetical protein
MLFSDGSLAARSSLQVAGTCGEADEETAQAQGTSAPCFRERETDLAAIDLRSGVDAGGIRYNALSTGTAVKKAEIGIEEWLSSASRLRAIRRMTKSSTRLLRLECVNRGLKTCFVFVLRIVNFILAKVETNVEQKEELWHTAGERRVSLQVHSVRTSRPLVKVMCLSFFA